MKNHFMKRYALLLTLFLLAHPAHAAFVTDKLLAGLYSAPETSSKPIKVLPSGTPFEVLDKQDDFSKVKLGDNSEGWLENQLITNEKPARVMLLQLQSKNSQLQKKLRRSEAQLKEQGVAPGNDAEVEELKLQLADARTQISTLSRQTENSTNETTPDQTTQTQLKALKKELESTKEELKSALAAPQQSSDSGLATENAELKARIENAATLLGATIEAPTEVTEEKEGDNLEIWHIALLALAILISFVGGVAYKNHLLARRYGGFRI